MQFDEFVASEPEAGTAQPMSDQDIVNIVLTKNDAQEESDDESEEEIPSASAIKTPVEFLAMIDQQKAFSKRNEMPTEIVEQLEAQVVTMHVTKDVSLVDSLDTDDMELESIDTTIASVATSALMKETPTRFSTRKCPLPHTSEPQPSTSIGTGSQPPPKKLQLGLSHPLPKTFKLHQAVDKVMNMSSGSSTVCTLSDSDAESLSLQE